ncbi:hypothetical protein PYCC9005_004140 [Savitreella phatthalungensis]
MSRDGGRGYGRSQPYRDRDRDGDYDRSRRPQISDLPPRRFDDARIRHRAVDVLHRLAPSFDGRRMDLSSVYPAPPFPATDDRDPHSRPSFHWPSFSRSRGHQARKRSRHDLDSSSAEPPPSASRRHSLHRSRGSRSPVSREAVVARLIELDGGIVRAPWDGGLRVAREELVGVLREMDEAAAAATAHAIDPRARHQQPSAPAGATRIFVFALTPHVAYRARLEGCVGLPPGDHPSLRAVGDAIDDGVRAGKVLIIFVAGGDSRWVLGYAEVEGSRNLGLRPTTATDDDPVWWPINYLRPASVIIPASSEEDDRGSVHRVEARVGELEYEYGSTVLSMVKEFGKRCNTLGEFESRSHGGRASRALPFDLLPLVKAGVGVNAHDQKGDGDSSHNFDEDTEEGEVPPPAEVPVPPELHSEDELLDD